jgi:hypothetical protein
MSFLSVQHRGQIGDRETGKETGSVIQAKGMRMNYGGLCTGGWRERAASLRGVSFNAFSIALPFFFSFITFFSQHSLQLKFLFSLFITEFDAHPECMSLKLIGISQAVHSFSEQHSPYNLCHIAPGWLPW